MVWIVIKEDPRPDQYIPVFIRGTIEDGQINWKNGSFEIFDNVRDALSYAVSLKKRFKVKDIRMFYLEGYSKIIKNDKDE